MLRQDSQEAESASLVVTYRDGVSVLSLLGEHDTSTASELRAEIKEAAERNHGIVVCFAETEFIDSAIVHILFQGDRLMLARGRRLVLHLGREPVVDRLLEIAGILEELIWTVSLEDAVVYAAQSDELAYA